MSYIDYLNRRVVVSSTMSIPIHHARTIQDNFNAGKPWWLCSPLYTFTRLEVAEIAAMELPKT